MNKLLIGLAAAALFYGTVVTLTEQHERTVEAVAKTQLEHVHRHLIAGCELVEGETQTTCEARWLTAVEK